MENKSMVPYPRMFIYKCSSWGCWNKEYVKVEPFEDATLERKCIVNPKHYPAYLEKIYNPWDNFKEHNDNTD